MKPQNILINLFQTGKHLLKSLYHTNKSLEITYIAALIILGEKSAVPETIVKYGLIRAGDPKAKIRLPQTFHSTHGVGKHCQRIELQTFKNHSCLLIHIGKTRLDQMILAVEIAVQGSGRNPRQSLTFWMRTPSRPYCCTALIAARIIRVLVSSRVITSSRQ